LWQVAQNFCSGITPWVIHFRETASVGYTVLKNTINA